MTGPPPASTPRPTRGSRRRAGSARRGRGRRPGQPPSGQLLRVAVQTRGTRLRHVVGAQSVPRHGRVRTANAPQWPVAITDGRRLPGRRGPRRPGKPSPRSRRFEPERRRALLHRRREGAGVIGPGTRRPRGARMKPVPVIGSVGNGNPGGIGCRQFGRQQPERVPALAAPALGRPAPLEHRVVESRLERQAAAHRVKPRPRPPPITTDSGASPRCSSLASSPRTDATAAGRRPRRACPWHKSLRFSPQPTLTVDRARQLVSTSKTAEQWLHDRFPRSRAASPPRASPFDRRTSQADALVALADLVGQPEGAEQVDVALDACRSTSVSDRATGGGDVADPRRDAGTARARAEELDRRGRRRHCPTQHGRDGRRRTAKSPSCAYDSSRLRALERLDAGCGCWGPPADQRFVARNWNLASSGWAFTAFRVANSVECPPFRGVPGRRLPGSFLSGGVGLKRPRPLRLEGRSGVASDRGIAVEAADGGTRFQHAAGGGSRPARRGRPPGRPGAGTAGQRTRRRGAPRHETHRRPSGRWLDTIRQRHLEAPGSWIAASRTVASSSGWSNACARPRRRLEGSPGGMGDHQRRPHPVEKGEPGLLLHGADGLAASGASRQQTTRWRSAEKQLFTRGHVVHISRHQALRSSPACMSSNAMGVGRTSRPRPGSCGLPLQLLQLEQGGRGRVSRPAPRAASRRARLSASGVAGRHGTAHTSAIPASSSLRGPAQDGGRGARLLRPRTRAAHVPARGIDPGSRDVSVCEAPARRRPAVSSPRAGA